MTNTTTTFAILCIAMLTGCPDRETRPGRDDTSQPADGDTGEASCEEDRVRLVSERDAAKAELAECRATAPK